jgi:hypothetical protein
MKGKELYLHAVGCQSNNCYSVFTSLALLVSLFGFIVSSAEPVEYSKDIKTNDLRGTTEHILFHYYCK